MSMTDTTALAAAALEVLRCEMELTSRIALAPGVPAHLRIDLGNAQAAYEVEVLARTPGAVGSTPTSYPAWS
jgi:hypothetical protein